MGRGVGVLYVQPEELGKEDIVETDKPRKKSQPGAKAIPAPPPKGFPSALSALTAAKPAPPMNPLMMGNPMLAGLGRGMPPAMPGMGGFPGMGRGMPTMPGMMGGPRPGMPGMPGMPMMGMP